MTTPYQKDNGRERRDLIVTFIASYKTQHGGICPSYREICAACDIPSVSTLHHHLTVLERTGRITRNKQEPRNIGLPGEAYTPPLNI